MMALPLFTPQRLHALFAVRLRPELKELYYFSLIYAFAYSLISVFEPVFFYKEGFSLSFIALYYGIHYSLYTLLLPLGGMFAARFGLERSLAVSLPIFVMYFLTLAAIPSRPELVWLAIALLTAHKIFYWPAYHAYFAKFGDAHNRGTELSWMNFVKSGVGILGPATGGFIALYFGFPTLFVVAALFLLASSWPLLQTPEHYRIASFQYATPWRIIVDRRWRNMTLAMMGMGENLIDMVFWPLFMFIILGSTGRLGLVSSLTMAVLTLVSFIIGEMADRFPRRHIIKLHLPFMMIGMLFRPLAGSGLQVLLTDTLNRMAHAGVHLPLVYRLYVQSRQTSIIGYMVAFETALALTKAIVAFGLAALFAWLLPYTAFTITFILAAVFALMYARL